MFAIDGMNLSLPSTTKTQEEFEILHRCSKDRVSPKISAIHDISNDLIVQVHIGTVKTDADERAHAKELILSPVLERRGTENCIIIFDRGYPGRDLICKLTEKKFPLDSGEIEMFVTNMLSETLSIKDFKELYFMHWGIETKFGELKNRILIEHFNLF